MGIQVLSLEAWVSNGERPRCDERRRRDSERCKLVVIWYAVC